MCERPEVKRAVQMSVPRTSANERTDVFYASNMESEAVDVERKGDCSLAGVSPYRSLVANLFVALGSLWI